MGRPAKFFRPSPQPIDSKLGATIESLYFSHQCGDKKTIALSEPTQPLPLPIDVRPLVAAALRNLFNNPRFEGIEENLFKATFDCLTESVGHGFKKPTPGTTDYTYAQLLQKSAWPFAARKTAQQQAELQRLASISKSFGAFRRAATTIVGNYNQRWLQVEYETAVQSAIMAERWHRAWERRDIFPNLEYLPSRAATPREEHKKFYGRIIPINDPFWNRYLPPSAFGCMCDVRPTAKQPTGLPETLPVLHKSFENNSGKSGVLLRSDQYELSNKAADKKAINAARDILAKYDLYVRSYDDPSTGYIDIHFLHDVKKEVEQNIASAKKLAMAGFKVRLAPILNIEGRKNPDAFVLIGGKWEIVDFKIKKSITYSSIQGVLNHAQHQAKIVFFDFMVYDKPEIVRMALKQNVPLTAIEYIIIQWKGAVKMFKADQINDIDLFIM